jgi:hypothetical protein
MSSPLPYEFGFDDFYPSGEYPGSEVIPELTDTSPIYTDNIYGVPLTAAELALLNSQTQAEELLGGVAGSGATGSVSNWWNSLSDAAKNIFSKKDAKGNPIPGQYDIGKILAAGGTAYAGIKSLTGGDTPKSNAYQGSIPTLSAVRQQVDYSDPNRRPGSTGRRYFTDTQYVAPAQTAATSQSQTTQADTISQQQAARDQELARRKAQSVDTRPIYPGPDKTGLTGGPAMPNGGWRGSDIPYRPDLNKKFEEFGFDLPLLSYLNKNRRDSDIDGGINYSYDPTTKTFMGNSRMSPVTKTLEEMQGLANNEFNTTYHYADDFKPIKPQQPVQDAPIGEPEQAPIPTQPQQAPRVMFAQGGLMGLAKGRYLQGSTDGMADELRTSIEGKQPAALSHGEFVVPADVVSHLGNGNSDAGAKKLYEMMARVRKARTGNPKQGKEINPDKFMPGGKVGYAEGGIARFNGETGSAVSTGVTTPAIPSQGTSVAEGLSSWAGPYVSNYLGKGQALADMPYQAYMGPLTAGASNLQQQQFAGLSNLAQTGFTPGQFNSGIFDTSAAQQYMNPYIKSALDPQIAELQRQGQIQNLQNQAKATSMGAFGGSGSRLMQTETQRNTLDKIQQALGQGYSTAYDKAMAQYNQDRTSDLEAQRMSEASRQFGANYGLSALKDLGAAGATQRDIEQQGISADRAQFEEERDDPYKKVQFQKSLLTGLPITTTDSTQMQSDIGKISNQIAGLTSLYKSLAGLGQI